jgi:hypothetical protein
VRRRRRRREEEVLLRRRKVYCSWRRRFLLNFRGRSSQSKERGREQDRKRVVGG